MKHSSATTSPRYFRLGIFVISGAVLILGGVMALGAASLFQRTVNATTIITESVNGLDVGSAVKYQGVTVGKVSSIDFAVKTASALVNRSMSDPTPGGILVSMSISAKGFPGMSNSQINDFIRHEADKGLRARLTTAGFSGQAYIELSIPDPKAYPPPEIGPIPGGIYIPSSPSAMGQALNAVEQIATDLQKANLPQVIAHYDQLAKRATVAVDGVTSLIEPNRPAIDSAIRDLPEITARLSSVSLRINTFLADPRVETFVASLPVIGRNADTTLSELRLISQELQSLINNNAEDVTRMIANLRRVSADAAVITDDARQYPARVIVGQPPARVRPGQ
jgi:ABC-type transporter Mla subunit MlaD